MSTPEQRVAAAEAAVVAATARQLPPQLKGIKRVGEEAYWLLVDALKAQHVSHEYCETQGGRLSKNRANEQFLSTLKVEIEAAIEDGKGKSK